MVDRHLRVTGRVGAGTAALPGVRSGQARRQGGTEADRVYCCSFGVGLQAVCCRLWVMRSVLWAAGCKVKVLS